MKKYERINLIITEFDAEDIITTSGANPNPNPHEDTTDPPPLDIYEGGFFW